MDTQPGEVRVNPNSRLCLYRHTLSHRPRADVRSSSWIQRSSQSCSSNSPSKVCYSSGPSLVVGETSFDVRFGASRPTQISASSALPLSSLAPQSGSVSGQDSLGSPLLRSISEMVDQASQRWEAHPGSRSSTSCVHRCLHQRLGSPLWQSVNSRSMASCRNTPPHKRVGVTGHSEGSAPLSTSEQRQGSDVPLRQQRSSGLPAEPRGHSLVAHVSPNFGDPSRVSAAQHHPVSESHPRSSECPSRRLVEKTSDHRHRMVSAPQHSASNVLHLVHSRVRPVRNSSQQQTGRVCVSSCRSSGNSSGCSVNSMGPALGICLSPNCADATSASQVGALEPVSNASGRSSSALPAMASNAS